MIKDEDRFYAQELWEHFKREQEIHPDSEWPSFTPPMFLCGVLYSLRFPKSEDTIDVGDLYEELK